MFLMPVPAPAPTQLWKPPYFSLAFLIPPEPHTPTHADAYPDSLIPSHPTRYLPEGCHLSHKNNFKKSQAVNKRLKLLLKKEGCCCRYRSWGIARVPQCRSNVCPGVHRRTRGEQPRPPVGIPSRRDPRSTRGAAPPLAGVPLVRQRSRRRDGRAPASRHRRIAAFAFPAQPSSARRALELVGNWLFCPDAAWALFFDFSACSFNNPNVVKTPELEPPFILPFPIFSKR